MSSALLSLSDAADSDEAVTEDPWLVREFRGWVTRDAGNEKDCVGFSRERIDMAKKRKSGALEADLLCRIIVAAFYDRK